MCDCTRLTAWLDKSGRRFRCPHCGRTKPHPCVDLFYHMDGHAFCDFCGLWMKLANPEAQPAERIYRDGQDGKDK